MKNVFVFSHRTIYSAAFFLIFSLFTSGAYAQQMDHNREVGLRIFGLNNFSFVYKKKKEENKYRRYRLGTAGIQFSTNQSTQFFSLGTNLAIGIEKRKPINNRFHFIHGTEYIGTFNIDATENQGNLSVSTGVGFVLGFQYAISNSFYVSLETIPSARITFGVDEEGFKDAVSINAGFNSQAAALSLVYQFQSRKKKNS